MILAASCVKCGLNFAQSLFVISITAAALLAQSSADLNGKVTDAQGGAISDARVTLFRQDTAAPQTVRTNESGEYLFTAVAPGNLLLEVKKEGFRTTTVNVALQRGVAKRQNVMLHVAGVNQSVIVTAAGEAQTPAEVSKAVSVISRDEIVNRNDYSVAGLLTTVPGVQIFNQGGPGQFTKMSIHGLRASAGAILVDGLRFRDAATTQGDATSFLPALNVVDTDHIEVLRGSGSSLYGTNAIGGAVNIVTDQGGGPLHGQVQIEGGTLGLFRARGTVAGGALQDKLKYTFGLLHLNVMSGVDGQDAYRSSGLQSFARYDFTPRLSLSGRFWGSDDFAQLNNSPTSTGIPSANIPSGAVISAIPLSPQGVKTFIAGGTPNFGNATYIPDVNDPDDRNASRFENAAFIFRDIATPTFNWQGYYQLVRTERVYNNGPVGIGPYQPPADNYSNYVGRIDTAGIRANKQLTSWLGVTGGYEFERETYFDHQDSHLPAPENVIERTHAQQRSNAAFFAAQFSPLNRRLQISLSGRVQTFSLSAPDFEYAGTENPYKNISLSPPKALTGDASIAYLFVRSNTKVRAHVGNSYRSPALFERFGAGFYNDFVTGKVVFTPYGDPRLAPDRYNSFDGGIDQYLFRDRVRASATVFYIRIAQLIGFNSNGQINPVTDPFGRSSGFINGAGGISRGGEVGIEARPTRDLTVSVAYTYTNANTDQDSQVPGFFHVFDTPKHMVTLVATNQWTQRLTTTVEMFHYSPYFDPSIGYLQAYRFPGFTKTDFVASYEFWRSETKSARFYAKVDNLFNQTYYAAGFLAPRATAIGGLGYAF